MAFWSWSKTAASNANADATIGWAEGQAPSTINDSARAMMARTAEYRDDMAGAIVTSGTLNAYTVSSFQGFDTLAHMNGQIIAFTVHATSGDTVTLNVDGLGAKPLRSATGKELHAGRLVAGTPYTAVYNNSDVAFYLHGFYGQPFEIPVGAGMDYWGPTSPSTYFAMPAGQAISRTQYSILFGIIGTTYGAGDGSTTYNLPDKTGRVSAMLEATATRLTTAGSGVDGGTLGSGGGSGAAVTLSQGNLPNVNFTISGIALSNGTTIVPVDGTSTFVGGGLSIAGSGRNTTTNAVNSVTTNVSVSNQGVAASGGSATPFKIVQPTIVCNYIMRII